MCSVNPEGVDQQAGESQTSYVEIEAALGEHWLVAVGGFVEGVGAELLQVHGVGYFHC